MHQAVQAYIDAIPSEHRALFDRLHQLILSVAPGASVTISYGIPTYKLGRRRVYVGAWQHGLSIYGWGHGGDGGFLARHPELLKPKATIRLRPEDAARIGDEEFEGLFRAALT
ncbi:MAG TPA: DUF1801 domain-containing protein [Chloroflexota bacterium]|nr:DUF1801 domain-containing protein [Chloroflexota bacterium]